MNGIVIEKIVQENKVKLKEESNNDVISNYKKFINKLIKKASIDMEVNKVDNYKFFHNSKEYKYVIYGLDYIKSLGYTIVKIDSFYSYLVTIDAHWANKL